METPQGMRTRVIEKASRGHGVSGPGWWRIRSRAVERELDISIPAGMAVQVHEESADTVHLVLPPNSKLSQADMQAIHAGAPPHRQVRESDFARAVGPGEPAETGEGGANEPTGRNAEGK